MRVFLVLLLCVGLVFSDGILAKNVIYVVIEGVSRSSFYALLNKGALPNLSRIASQGNYRNMGIVSENHSEDRLQLLAYSGLSVPQKSGDFSVFNYVQYLRPTLDIKVFLSSPLKTEYPKNTQDFLYHLIDETASMALDTVSSQELGDRAYFYLKQVERPFFIMMNFTNVTYVAKRYREGAQLYSQAIQNCDRAIGRVLEALDTFGFAESTEIVVVTTHGFHSKSKEVQFESWVLSSRKVMRKGNFQDVFVSLLDVLDVTSPDLSSMLQGKSLFDLVSE